MSVKILIADHIFTPEGFRSNEAVAFDTSILAVAPPDQLTARYPDAILLRTPPHTIIYPGLINPHVHLEFSANRSTLNYGDFMAWLESVIEKRDELINRCDHAVMAEATQAMLRSGITHFGAISSFGSDLEVCRHAPQRVTFFNELIGSSAQAADMLYGDFLERLNHSMNVAPHERITPAIAIHAPDSVHPVRLSNAGPLAKEKSLPLSAHFLESGAEREWLEQNSGGFLGFFQKFFSTDRAVTSIDEFMHAFDTYPTLFIHGVHTTAREREHLAAHGHTIAHCPRSNRLLGCGRLPIEDLQGMPMALATDGLSSNWSLNLWDEMRAALMLHHQGPLPQIAERLIRSVTQDAAKALHSDAGRIVSGAPADLITVTLPEHVEDPAQLALQSILHTHEASQIFIEGANVN